MGQQFTILVEGRDGGVPAERFVDVVVKALAVLRDLDAQAHTLLIYTDSRSPKARQIQTHPQGMLVLWSEKLGWQLRLTVSLTLETSGLRVSSRWAQLKLTPAAHDYLSPLPPGSVVAPQPSRNEQAATTLQ